MATKFLDGFVSNAEAEARSTLSSVTIWRRSKAGTFPKRVKITARRVGYRRAEFEAWLVDPQNWRQSEVRCVRCREGSRRSSSGT
ncbi:helix-turn-helix transcriptional regulator [Bradyrhizobium sp. CCBAU 65884]|uniref:helix-turn-helix transcriptional regulator n=1 Tax=Bradyrhizobium sp. CCBAU 65884 TaxID=722477 RepID=UPI003FA4BBAE